MTRVEFFYDVISPYTYLAWHSLKQYRIEWGLQVELRPMFLGGVMKESGNQPPAVVPAKGKHLGVDLRRSVKLLGLERYQGTPLNFFSQVAREVVKVQRMLAIACASESPLTEQERWKLTDTAFSALWEDKENRLPDNSMKHIDDAFLERLLSKSDLPSEKRRWLLQEGASSAAKALLLNTTKDALEKGAFGAPTFFFPDLRDGKGELVFGSDRWEVIAFLIGKSYRGPSPCPERSRL